MINIHPFLYTLNPINKSKQEIISLIQSHPEIKFVSLVAVDFSGNGTDEKIPISYFYENYEDLLNNGIQTDGSSVTLDNIASLDDAKVTLIPDLEAEWIVDYNWSIEIPIGTLRIPSFLGHHDKLVCSRSILKRAEASTKESIYNYLENHSTIKEELGINTLESVFYTSATELEFWVKSPGTYENLERLNYSQQLKEQYWKRTEGNVRTALEHVLLLMEAYGFKPEMGHKEVGGVTYPISKSGQFEHVLQQIEIDWKYSDMITNCDRECFIRHLVKDIFHLYQLEVTFKAKPLKDVAGSGKHTHIGLFGKSQDKVINLINSQSDYMSSLGYSALMGILHNYEVINPFVAWTIDSLNRLKPHFEAPVNIVTSLGKSVNQPSRNRSVLIGLIKDLESPMSTRFELRSPSPHNNTYLILAACLCGISDGLHKTLNLSLQQLHNELSKSPQEKGMYLEKGRAYRCEEIVFDLDDLDIFGQKVETVYQALLGLDSDKKQSLTINHVFTDQILDSYQTTILNKWYQQLHHNFVAEVRSKLKNMTKLDELHNDLDKQKITEIITRKQEILKSDINHPSLLAKLESACTKKQGSVAHTLFIEINQRLQQLENLYKEYLSNF